jgi:hypothetical protein
LRRSSNKPRGARSKRNPYCFLALACSAPRSPVRESRLFTKTALARRGAVA